MLDGGRALLAFRQSPVASRRVQERHDEPGLAKTISVVCSLRRKRRANSQGRTKSLAKSEQRNRRACQLAISGWYAVSGEQRMAKQRPATFLTSPRSSGRRRLQAVPR